jgi:hypothetical protein
MAETYRIKYERKSEPFERRALRFAFVAVQCTIVWCLISLIPWFRLSNQGVIETFLTGLGFGIFFAILFPLATKPFRQYELRVSDDSLTADYGYYTRTIYKRELRTVWGTSRHGASATCANPVKIRPVWYSNVGFIWVPRPLR